jgi:hypothetical protein
MPTISGTPKILVRAGVPAIGPAQPTSPLPDPLQSLASQPQVLWIANNLRHIKNPCESWLASDLASTANLFIA